jgi:hypothetical protein
MNRANLLAPDSKAAKRKIAKDKNGSVNSANVIDRAEANRVVASKAVDRLGSRD